MASCQGTCPPRQLDDVRVVVFAGDHGVSADGVSAYPAAITPAMVYGIAGGHAGVSALAAANDVTVRIYDLGVAVDFPDLPAEISRFKVRQSSGAIHLTDALSRAEVEQALEAGDTIAAEQIADGAQNRYAWRSYLADVSVQNPPRYAVASRRADLTGLPPAWIGVGNLDLFLAEDRDYAERLRAAGVPCELDVVPGMYHGADTALEPQPATMAAFWERIATAITRGPGGVDG